MPGNIRQRQKEFPLQMVNYPRLLLQEYLLREPSSALQYRGFQKDEIPQSCDCKVVFFRIFRSRKSSVKHRVKRVKVECYVTPRLTCAKSPRPIRVAVLQIYCVICDRSSNRLDNPVIEESLAVSVAEKFQVSCSFIYQFH